MPELTGEQITLIIGAVIAGVAAVWRWFVRPKVQKITELEAARSEAEKVRDELKDFVLARIERAEKERDEANGRAGEAIASHAAVTRVLQELTGVITNGNHSALEEIRIVRSVVESIQRNAR